MHFQKICVIGLGYIGLPTASILATNGLQVIGIDTNSLVITTLRQGNVHISEPGLRGLVSEALGTGRLVISDQIQAADAFIIAVPTPFFEDKEGNYNGQDYRLADMRSVIKATESILPYLQRGNLVVLESTSPPRTTLDLVRPILERSGIKGRH